MGEKNKKFTDYYRSDPEFRRRHLDRIQEKIECECGFVTAKCNLSRHRKSHIHIKKMKSINKIKDKEQKILDEMEELENELRKMKMSLQKKELMLNKKETLLKKKENNIKKLRED